MEGAASGVVGFMGVSWRRRLIPQKKGGWGGSEGHIGAGWSDLILREKRRFFGIFSFFLAESERVLAESARVLAQIEVILARFWGTNGGGCSLRRGRSGGGVGGAEQAKGADGDEGGQRVGTDGAGGAQSRQGGSSGDGAPGGGGGRIEEKERLWPVRERSRQGGSRRFSSGR